MNDDTPYTQYKYSVIIPIMNEEGNIVRLAEKIIESIKAYGEYEIIFIDDGSTDKTLEYVKILHQKNTNIQYLSFSRNFGHQNALKAGLDYATGDCVISMDGDGQHPPELLPEMIAQWQKGGYDIVYTIRKDDPNLGWLKKTSSKLFYKIMNYFADFTLEPGSADFRLLDKSVVQVIHQFHESPLFFRGLMQWIGFKQTAIEYMPQQRFWGQSKYTLKKMFNFALNGILSFSIKPLLFSVHLGILTSICGFLYGIYIIYEKFFTDSVVPGWATLVVLVLFIGGIQLIVMGVIGTYLGKLFIEAKKRPPYIIRELSIKAEYENI